MGEDLAVVRLDRLARILSSYRRQAAPSVFDVSTTFLWKFREVFQVHKTKLRLDRGHDHVHCSLICVLNVIYSIGRKMV